MKKLLLVLLISSGLVACGKISYESNLGNMERAVKQHIKRNDAQNSLKTDIELLRAISYEEIPEDKRIGKEDAYLCKVYLVAKSSYLESARIYNINDTLTCYFDDSLKFLRWDKND